MWEEINKTQLSLKWIERKFDDQINNSKQCSCFRIHYEKYNPFDFIAFHSEAIEYRPQKILSEIREFAIKNIDLYNNKVKMLENSNEVIILIFADNGEVWFPPAKNEDYLFPTNNHLYSNNDLAYYCAAIVDFLDKKILDNKKDRLSARQELLILKYKNLGRCIPFPKSRQYKGTSKYKLYYEVFGNKPTQKNDIEAIMVYLVDCPLAHKAAQNDLDRLN